MTADRMVVAGATMVWDADARIFLASYAPRARPAASDARVMLRWMDARIADGRRFGLLVDLANADHTAIAWRFRWMGWFYANRARMRVAIYNASRFDAVAKHFARATGTRIDAFVSEGAARASLVEWLAEQGEGEPTGGLPTA